MPPCCAVMDEIVVLTRAAQCACCLVPVEPLSQLGTCLFSPILKCNELPKLNTGGSNSTRTVSCSPAVVAPCGCPAATGNTRPLRPTAPGRSPNNLNATCSELTAQQHLGLCRHRCLTNYYNILQQHIQGGSEVHEATLALTARSF